MVTKILIITISLLLLGGCVETIIKHVPGVVDPLPEEVKKEP